MDEPKAPPRVLGRYAIHEEIAAGGMATVHIGRLLGPAGFSRTVAIKRLHPQFAKDPEFVTMFLDEARLAVRIQHPNVVQTLDVVADAGELFIVMEYLHGETVGRLLRTHRKPVPPELVVSIVTGALYGLHAAHEARSDRGEPLGIIHRDISPQNLFVGRDGVTRVLDFGVAKAAGRFHTTEEGKVKGKLPYMAPEQIRSEKLSCRTDIYAASVVLWELLVGRRYVKGQNPGAIVEQVLFKTPEAPSQRVPSLPSALDAIVLRGLSRKPDERFASAREMALALEAAVRPALASEVGGWVDGLLGEELTLRAESVARMESGSDSSGMSELMAGVVAPASQPSATGEPATLATHVATPTVDSSSVSALISAPILLRPPNPWPRRALFALVAVVLLGVGFGLSRAFTNVPVASSTSASDVPAAPEPEAAADTSSQQSPSKPAEPPEVETPASAATITPPDAPAAKAPAAKPAAAPSPRPAPAPKPRADCNPPWTLDGDGRKRYKMECL